MTSAIIVAAGRGTRMGPNIDKLFLELAGKPVVAHTWAHMDQEPGVHEVILVVRQGLEGSFKELACLVQPTRPYKIVVGGPERQDSVWNGLQAVAADTEIVAVQDGARPCTPRSLLDQVVEAARRVGAAVAARRMTDTVKESQDGRVVSNHLDRTRLWAVQTPQCFQRLVLTKALLEVRDRNLLITDDTAACELIAQSVQLVEAASPNPKVTNQEDLPYVEWLLRTRADGSRLESPGGSGPPPFQP